MATTEERLDALEAASLARLLKRDRAELLALEDLAKRPGLETSYPSPFRRNLLAVATQDRKTAPDSAALAPVLIELMSRTR